MRLAATVALVALTASIASAEPPGMTAPSAVPQAEQLPPIDYTDSYRGQVLGSDGIAVGLVVLAAMNGGNHGRSTNTTSLLELALATYALGAPLVHVLHDRPGRAAASLGLRLGVPFVLALVGSYLTSNHSCSGYGPDYCDTDSSAGLEGAILGALGGIVAASVLDAVFLAKGDQRPSATHITVAPIRDGGISFGVASTF